MIGGVPAGIPVTVCTSCGRRWFPQRLLCPACGSGDVRREWATRGTVEETTSLQRIPGRTLDEPVLLATVRLDVGPHVIARLEAQLAPGAEVELALERGAPAARAR